MKYDERFEMVCGSFDAGELTVYALSTCGFCKRAITFLRDNSVSFKYLYVDDLPMDMKEDIKAELSEKFNKQVRYPFLVINGERCLVGFTEDEWKTALGIR